MIAFDPDGRITVVNDEARNLLGLGTALGRRLEEVLSEGRLRRALDGTLTGTDLSVLTDDHCLVVNRMPVALLFTAARRQASHGWHPAVLHEPEMTCCPRPVPVGAQTSFLMV